MMSGKTWAEGGQGKGSVFNFALPAEVSSVYIPKPKEEPIQSKSIPNVKMRILLAEDNLVNQKVTIKMLKKIGHAADVAADGIEVLEALERRRYDVIFMDVQMPEMDGLEAARQIRARWPAEDQPKIIALTAYAIEGVREQCLEAGMDDYITKPLKINELANAIGKRRPGV
ncbi:MAG TPA: response regulator [Methanotrichaceae archaeon]|nr:response regulator [Methanotrichaceae archaeon]